MKQIKQSLQNMEIGEKGIVSGYSKDAGVYREKLLSMGLTKGTEFILQRRAPMGDPVEILVRGFSLSLRKNEAAALLIENQ